MLLPFNWQRKKFEAHGTYIYLINFITFSGNCTCSGECECGMLEFEARQFPYFGEDCSCNDAFCYENQEPTSESEVN